MTGLAIPWRDAFSFSWLAYQLVGAVMVISHFIHRGQERRQERRQESLSTPSKLWSTYNQ